MTENGAAIVLAGVHRRFEGGIHAVRGIDFEVPRGKVVGFIGANGAGKTTTMRMMVTLDLPTSGRIRVCGVDVGQEPTAVRRLVGWMPDRFEPYEDMTVLEYLDLFARAYELRGKPKHRRLAEVMAFTDLDGLAGRLSSQLSTGMRQRLCLARALLADPEILVLDEPAAGLDPKARVEFKNLVRLLAAQDKTLFISSHILSELGEMCDNLLFIHEGRIVHQGTASQLTSLAGTRQAVHIRVRDGPRRLRTWCEMRPGLACQEELRDGVVAEVDGEGEGPICDLVAALAREGFQIYEVRRVERNLEEAFIDLIKAQKSGDGADDGPGYGDG